VPQTPGATTPQVAAAPTALPNTGSQTWAIFLIGLVALLAGAGLTVLSRRPA
jgi:LPXTG-motif cell wall-anchored protein